MPAKDLSSFRPKAMQIGYLNFEAFLVTVPTGTSKWPYFFKSKKDGWFTFLPGQGRPGE